MPPRTRRPFSTLSLVLFVLAALPIYRELSRRSDIWWTPHAMLVPLAESKDRVEIYAGGKPLAALLQAGQLRLAEDGGSRALEAREIGLRFNNSDRVRAERLPLLLACAEVCGDIVLLFVLALDGRLDYLGQEQR